MKLLALLFLGCLGLSSAFVTPRSALKVSMPKLPLKSAVLPCGTTQSAVSARPRSGAVQMGLFGLGTPELVVIAVIAAAVVGPKNLKKLAGDFGKVAGELKDVPEEFQRGVDEGKKAAMDKAIAAAPDGPPKEEKEAKAES